MPARHIRVTSLSREPRGPISRTRGMRGAIVAAMKTPAAIRRLISACVDDERTLRHERGFVDPTRAAALARMGRERAQFVDDLERLVGPSRSRATGSWAELFRELGRNLQVLAGGRNNGDAIAACRHSRARTEALYEQAMQRPWQDRMRVVLEGQQRRLEEASAELNRLQF
jgi:hypothetical protein